MSEILNHKVVGDGEPLVILHGLFGSLDNWITLGKKFGERFKVVLVDQRNHGKSFHADQFNYDAMASDLEKLIQYLGLENPSLIGHSMGGKTVMQYAAYHPTDINKLLVADIGPKAYPVHHAEIIKGLKSLDLSKIANREDADIQLEKAIPDMGVRSFLLKNLKRDSNGGFQWKMNLDVISNNISNVGKQLDYYLPIDVPTLFVRGGNSNYILDEDQDTIEEIFPDSNLLTVESAGHWIHAEQPGKFYEMTMEFLT